jgi:hypothetical protein
MPFNIPFTRGTPAMNTAGCLTPAVNHDACAFIENKRYRRNQPATADMVNRNGRFVYQTDQVFVVYSPRAGGLG